MLPMPVQAAAIPGRVEQSALFGMEFCIDVRGALHQLNRMQVGWAKALLGIRDCPQGQWSFLVVECGWTVRLGTRMIMRAILLHARIVLLPVTCPAHIVASRARACKSNSWVSSVASLCKSNKLPQHISLVEEMFPTEAIDFARQCKTQRQKLLQQYTTHVKAALRTYDEHEFQATAANSVWPYNMFQ